MQENDLEEKEWKNSFKKSVLTILTQMMQCVTKKWNSQRQGLKPPNRDYKEFSDLFIHHGE